MARNTPLAMALQLLKAEIGLALSPGVAPSSDEMLYSMMESRQIWLAGEFDWPFLKQYVDVNITAGVRYFLRPTDAQLSWERPVVVATLFNRIWNPMSFGIGIEEYNALSSGDGNPVMPQDPARKWDYKLGDDTYFEIWPIAAGTQTVRFTGYRPLASLRNASTGGFGYDPTATLDLDDRVVVLFTAADYLTRLELPDAKNKLALAEQRLAKLRASSSQKRQVFVLGQQEELGHKYIYRRPRLN